MKEISLEFGFYPKPFELDSGSVKIRTLPDLIDKVKEVQELPHVKKDWIYSPNARTRNLMSGRVYENPYPARIFGLAKTHVITHENASCEDQLIFHIWSLSFFTGIRLSTTEAGFLDATPIKEGKLVDFIIKSMELEKSIAWTEKFWHENKETRQIKRFEAVVHALFLAQNPKLLQFERFLFLYMALDACYRLAADTDSPTCNISHAGRIQWMCQKFDIEIPAWANSQAKSNTEIADIRNDAIHEALYMDEPLGFAVRTNETGVPATLEMRALISRLLIAILVSKDVDYVGTPTNTRQRYLLNLPS